jgi:tRNA(fMet)-specific endonuclease VapC
MLKYMPDTNIEIYTMKKKPALVRAAFKKDDGRMGNSSINSITDPPLLRHRERSVAIHYSYLRYRRSLDCHVGC